MNSARRISLAACAALLLAVWARPASASGGDASLFAQANAAYDKADYAAAIDAYSQLELADPDEPAYHFDLGNCEMKSGKLGKAVASYLRAFALAPRDSDIRTNLSFALGRAGEEMVPAGIPQSLFLLAYALSRNELQGLLALAVWLFCAAAGLYALNVGRPLLGPAVGWTLAATAFFGGWLLLLSSLAPNDLAVTLRADAEVRSGPGTNFGVSYTLPEGRRLDITGEQGDWLEVVAPKEGFKGWMRKDSLEKI
jgi:tetratricopeptide (TPR) repeat protein